MLSIERRSGLSRFEFYKNYYIPSVPVIVTDITDDWIATDKWKPAYFSENFGSVEINAIISPPQEGADPTLSIRNNNNRFKTTILDFVKKTHCSEDVTHMYISQIPISENLIDLKKDITYFPYISKTLQRLTASQPYLWMGPGGCKSPLHLDDDPNLHAQIYGSKRWVIFPRGQCDLLYLPSDLQFTHLSPVNIEKPNLVSFPKFSSATPIEFTINAGEVLFLPAKWAHFVEALDYSISLNLWWPTWLEVPGHLFGNK